MLLDSDRRIRYLTVSASSLLSFPDSQKCRNFGSSSCESNEGNNAWTTSPNSPASIFYKKDKDFARNNSSTGEDYFYFQEKRCKMKTLLRTGLVAFGCVLICGSVAAFIYVNENEKPPTLNKLAGKFEPANCGSENVIPKTLPNDDAENSNNKNKSMKISLERFLSLKQIAQTEAEKFLWLGDGTLLLRDFETSNYLNISVDENHQKNEGTSKVSKDLFLSNEEIIKAVGAPYSEINFSHDGTFAAIYLNSKKVYRHSRKITVKLAQVIKSIDETRLKIVHDLEDIQLFEWASNANEYVYVSGNQIYHCLQPQCKNVIAITSKLNDGRSDAFIYNGITDWVYEEEIFGNSKALWWSGTGEYLAFMSVNDTNVTKVQIQNHKPFLPNPTYETIPYPETGTKNIPDISLWIWSKKNVISKMILPPKKLVEDKKGYLLLWANWMRLIEFESEPVQDQLISIWSNREQNLVIISICREIEDQFIQQITKDSMMCDTLTVLDYSIVNGMRLWIEPENFRIEFFSNNGFFVILPDALAKQKFSAHSDNSKKYIDNDDNHFSEEKNESDVFDIVAHIDIHSGEITSMHGANYDVSKILGYDWKGDNLFFSSGGGTIGELHLFHVPTAAGATSIPPQCITCLAVDEDNNSDNSGSTNNDVGKWCDHHSSAVFSQDSTRFVLQCTRPFFGRKIFLKNIENLEQNIQIGDYYINMAGRDSNIIKSNTNKSISTPKIHFLKLQTARDDEAHVRIIHSPEFDFNNKNASNSKLHPVLLYVYGGPNTVQSLKATPQPILSYFAIVKNAIVVTIDASGSARRGWRLRSKLYANFGNVEIEDQIYVLRKIIAKYNWIMDAKRVAVFGWSYGGFAAISIAQRDSGSTVQCAAAVAPVTDFRFYDSVYTERYMGLLNKDTQIRFSRASLLNATAIEVFRERVKLFLAHGLADDNVHYHNSALLSAMLQEQNIHFVQEVYTNHDHSIGSSRQHLYMELTRFLHDCWGM